MDFGSLTAITSPVEAAAKGLKGLFAGLGYFLGGDFQKALDKGFML